MNEAVFYIGLFSKATNLGSSLFLCAFLISAAFRDPETSQNVSELPGVMTENFAK